VLNIFIYMLQRGHWSTDREACEDPANLNRLASSLVRVPYPEQKAMRVNFRRDRGTKLGALTESGKLLGKVFHKPLIESNQFS
jgi:hypothetical protein